MAGVAEQNGADGAVGPLDPQHGHIPVHRPVGVVAEHDFVPLVYAAVHGKGGPSQAVLEHCRLAVSQCGAHDLHQLGPQQPAVVRDPLALLWPRLGHVRERLLQHRRGMRVTGDDGDRAAAQLESVSKLLQDRLHESGAHLAVVERHEHKPLP